VVRLLRQPGVLPGRSDVGELKSPDKPFEIAKRDVWEAYQKIKANKGAPGVDGVTLAKFEEDLRNNLYRVWNRMSSGSYFPPPVLAVEIPKAHGAGMRTLGVPTVADRVAQTVVATHLERLVEPIFHPDSYGYRPKRSALDAVAVCRRRCWKADWVIDLDIQKFFDSVPHDLIVKAVEAHTDARWAILYIKRWLKAPMQMSDGKLAERDRGTPQGSAVSPVLANLFLHYAFDAWMARKFPTIAFERYVDDAVVHCVSERQARAVVRAIKERFEEVGLRLHPTKTQVVYCKDANRTEHYPVTAFTFLGFTFRARGARRKDGKVFTSFLPAVSKDALMKMSAEVRRWRLHLRTGHTFVELARKINPIVRGWMQYYGAFYGSALFPLLQRINTYLMRWIRQKYRRFRARKKVHACWKRITSQYPRMFAHWKWVHSPW
jgi:RNA-directed DNA polymerase